MIDKLRIKISDETFTRFSLTATKCEFFELKNKIHDDNVNRYHKTITGKTYFYVSGVYFINDYNLFVKENFIEFNPANVKFDVLESFIDEFSLYDCDITRIDYAVDIECDIYILYFQASKFYNNNIQLFHENNRLSGFYFGKSTNKFRIYDKKLERIAAGFEINRPNLTRIELQSRKREKVKVLMNGIRNGFKNDVFEKLQFQTDNGLSLYDRLYLKEFGMESLKQKYYRNRHHKEFSERTTVINLQLLEQLNKSCQRYCQGLPFQVYTQKMVDSKHRLTKADKFILLMLHHKQHEDLICNNKLAARLQLLTKKRFIYESGALTPAAKLKIEMNIVENESELAELRACFISEYYKKDTLARLKRR